MVATESAVLVPIPEAETAVGQLRAELDAAAERGVPAHVTVLYPFVPPEQIGPAVIGSLAEVCAATPAFDVTFASIRWFGDDVVWLAPEPSEPFRVLTQAVCGRFPGYMPYGGAYDIVIPHLTVGNYHLLERLTAAAETVRKYLPVRARVAAAALMTGSAEPGSWHVLAELPLG